MSVRMPSLADTPHVEVAVPLSTLLPCGGSLTTRVPIHGEMLVKLAYQLSGYVAEYNFNEGEHRDIAGFDDMEESFAIAKSLADAMGVESHLVLGGTLMTIDEIFSLNYPACKAMVDQLLSDGCISSADIKVFAKGFRKKDIAVSILANLNKVDDEIIDRMDRLFA